MTENKIIRFRKGDCLEGYLDKAIDVFNEILRHRLRKIENRLRTLENKDLPDNVETRLTDAGRAEIEIESHIPPKPPK